MSTKDIDLRTELKAQNCLLVDTHGCHSIDTTGLDDGTSSIAEHVASSCDQNIIPIPTAHNSLASIPSFLDEMSKRNLSHFALAGVELMATASLQDYGNTREIASTLMTNGTPTPDLNHQRTYTSEVIFIFPPEKRLLKKMVALVDTWAQLRPDRDNTSLVALFDHFQSGLSQAEFTSMLKHLPHPISADYDTLTQLATNIFEPERGSFVALEAFYTTLNDQIDTYEALNASHSGPINKIACHIARKFNKLPLAGSDSHNHVWNASAANLIQIDEDSSQGIIHALKTKPSVMISGFGNKSLHHIPSLLWLSTIKYKLPTGKLKLLHTAIDYLRDIKTPTLEVLSQQLQNKPPDSWVYYDHQQQKLKQA